MTTATDIDFSKPQRLYKLAANGKMTIWEVQVEGATITNRFGFEDGTITEAPDTILVGKGIGTKKETTPEQQALLEAKSRWEKAQKHKGYVVDRAKAQAGERARTSPVPMLAEKFKDHGHKAIYPALMQPKFDGMRCLATYADGEVKLTARTGGEINTVPHVNQAIKELAEKNGLSELILDGELYSHAHNRDFEEILSMVKRGKLHPNHTVVQYHIYDIVNDEVPFWGRHEFLERTIPDGHQTLLKVETVEVKSAEEAEAYYFKQLAEGYEGAMLRNRDSLYSHRRTTNLLKLKPTEEAEFPITGIEVGRGKMSDKPVFILTAANGEEFRAKMSGPMEDQVKYVEDESLWRGKKMTVTYQNLTSYGVPRGPVARRIRDYE